MKTLLKYTIIFIGILFTTLIITPFFFKDRIKDSVISTINNNIEAKINFDNINFSFIKDFPHASISITNLSVITKSPFEGDTLIYANSITAKMAITEIFKSSDRPINIQEFSIKNALANIIFNEKGISNYDISIKNTKNDENTSNKVSKNNNLALSIQKYRLENVRLTYTDKSTKTKLVLDKINHIGKGDFTSNFLDLDTHTSVIATIDFNGINYTNSTNLLLDAILSLDLERNKLSFKENIAHVNNIPLKFDGFIQLNDKGQQYDIKFSTPTSSFDSAMKLIPSAFVNTKDVKTTGNFSLNGWINGIFSENKIPLFNIEMFSDKASIKYSELPKTIENISIDTKIINQTGEIKDTYLDINKFSFKIDNDIFNIKAKISDITKNIRVNANVDGIINLANLSNAYPLNLEQKLSGIIKTNIDIILDINSLKQKKYENINTKGALNLTNFTYKSEEFSKPFTISQMDLKFNPSYVQMNKLNAKIGDSDLQVRGNLDNFYGFLFKKQVLKGEFDLKSDIIKISDLLTTNKSNKNISDRVNTISVTEKAKIPSFLNCKININIKKLIYDDLNLENVLGNITIKNETLRIHNLKTNIFEGNIGINGNISTKLDKPTFDINLNLENLDISQSFSQLRMLEKIAPISNAVTGKINSKIKVSGNLHDKELTPEISSIKGSLLGELHNTKIDRTKSKLLSNLDNSLNLINLDNINLDKLKVDLTFENEKVNIKPMYINYQDISIKLSGSHSFDESMDYNAIFNVPAKYFSNNIEDFFTNKNDIGEITVPISAKITGKFSSPKIQTDINQVLNNISKQILNKKKNNFIEKILKDTKLNNTKNHKENSENNTVNEITNLAKETLNNLFNRKK